MSNRARPYFDAGGTRYSIAVRFLSRYTRNNHERTDMTKHATISWSLCLATAAVLVGGGQPAGAAPPQANAPLEERVASVVKSEILAKGVPSVSVAVMRDGKLVLERAWGVADVEKNLSASAATTYFIGSVTKQFTAALLLKQVERGRLALTDPIGKHLAGLSPEVGAVTIEQLLNHTSGMKRSAATPERRFENVTVDTLLEMAAGGELVTKAGTKHAYSNAGYVVLGILVEKLYGKKFGAVVQDEIAGPLGLTTLRKCAEPQLGDARGYELEPGPSTTLRGGKADPAPGLHHSQLLGQDGLCATAGDLVRWTHALHTGRVLSHASYQAMITPRGAAVASNYGFGLSVNPAAWGDETIFHGGGSLTGNIAEVHWFPEHSVATALLYNVFPRVPGVSDVIPRIVFGVPLAGKAPQAEPANPAPAPATTMPAERTTLAGIYALTAQRTFEVTLENGELYVTPPGGSKQPLVFRSGNTYALGSSDSKTTITFILENGVATGFEANDNGNRRTLKKITSAPQERKEITVPEEILKTYVGEYEFAPDENLKITFENGSLWGEPPGSAKRQMFAESETKFFVKTSPTEVTFQKDEKGNVIGVIVKSGPRPEMKLKKVK
jgi:CubicO group peptidase (beta-lactamase class C family)